MVPPLDLSHAKVMIAPPRLNLRRNASYNNCDKAPLSSTSARFSFNHLLFSPPPSPSLPVLVPRPKKSPAKVLIARPSRVLRYVLYLVTLLTTFYVARVVLRNKESIVAVWPHFTTEEFEMVGQDALPDFPTPIVVSHSHSRSKWTVSIPHGHDFPLSVEEYAGMGSKCREVSAHTRELRGKAPRTDEDMLNYDAVDEYFVDVYEAEQSGLLPAAGHGSAAGKTGHFVGLNWESMAGLPVCQSSVTYVLESSDAGLGTAVMGMWMLYGLAKHDGRAFFVDDSRWAYGQYTDIFEAPPLPDCRPPPRHQMLPCPAQAKHLVVTGTTLKDVFPALMAKYHRAAGTDNNLRDLMGLARSGYEALFKLNGDDQEFAQNRVKELRKQQMEGDTALPPIPIVGIHVRRGDSHPLEYQYRNTYVPSEVFLNRAQELVSSFYSSHERHDAATSNCSITIIASDDPAVYKQPDFSDALVAQERIRLASKEAAPREDVDPHVLHHFEDETLGWEGGFFASMFWNLGFDRKHNGHAAGASAALSSSSGRMTEPPSEQTLQLRSYMGRAYMLDLAVLAGASDRIVCTVSSMGCKMLGVMMGWEAGIEGGGWNNVDGDYPWAWMN
ncbi:hypothetical protein BBK36DRAFT_1140824 [Trichoderma citrinoviride]|uniref:Glycosyltransferase family 23 protein n=1 Tax=Trichoderma citrinoviride TaxID=58853 RepID=A0A2T4BCM0_9HYPO|nr:hypothetical protein BBK36DRAFT_1140824 [Trichoderma citrinoviride]PTB67067.1 hypothetical protein BBK36DRAFT_1140824 [Trichoderma citrinoviride]